MAKESGPHQDNGPSLVERLQNLNERLRDAEFQSSSRSQELVALKAKISSILAQNRRANSSLKLPRVSNEFVDSNILTVPGLLSFMPHLLSSRDNLKPALHISKDRIGGELAGCNTIVSIWTRLALPVYSCPSMMIDTKSYLVNEWLSAALNDFDWEDFSCFPSKWHYWCDAYRFRE